MRLLWIRPWHVGKRNCEVVFLAFNDTHCEGSFGSWGGNLNKDFVIANHEWPKEKILKEFRNPLPMEFLE